MSRVGIEQAIGANFDQVISASAQLANLLEKKLQTYQNIIEDYEKAQSEQTDWGNRQILRKSLIDKYIAVQANATTENKLQSMIAQKQKALFNLQNEQEKNFVVFHSSQKTLAELTQKIEDLKIEINLIAQTVEQKVETLKQTYAYSHQINAFQNAIGYLEDSSKLLIQSIEKVKASNKLIENLINGKCQEVLVGKASKQTLVELNNILKGNKQKEYFVDVYEHSMEIVTSKKLIETAENILMYEKTKPDYKPQWTANLNQVYEWLSDTNQKQIEQLTKELNQQKQFKNYLQQQIQPRVENQLKKFNEQAMEM